MKYVLLALHRYDRPVHEGIAAYAAEQGWLLNSDLHRRMGKLRGKWSGDGAIAYKGSKAGVFGQIISSGCPIVLVNDNAPEPEFPSVGTNIQRAAELAFEFYRRKGFQYFGVYGWPDSERLAAFRELANDRMGHCHVLEAIHSDIHVERRRIREWLECLPKPLAVYCNNDDEGYRFIHLAKSVGISIPSEVSVLATDNSPLICDSAAVPLSSVDTNLFEVGYRAAAKLDLLMSGKDVVRQDLVEPIGVVARKSTDTVGAASPHIRKAIAIFEADFDKGITVEDVVSELEISHVSLVKVFKKELGYTPGKALRDVRMKVAAQQLIATDHKIQAVALSVGMSNVDYFQVAFKKHFGKTPRKYRLENRC